MCCLIILQMVQDHFHIWFHQLAISQFQEMSHLLIINKHWLCHSPAPITLCGNTLFLNNLGTKGRAISLKPSTLNIAGNTSIYFYNNTARETGGAIYATASQDINLNCFYQLLDFSNEYSRYNIWLISNTARIGRDHIYSEYMHSGACFASPNRDSNKHDSGTLSYLVQNGPCSLLFSK